MTRPSRNVVAFGPELPDFGSWNWLGVDLIAALKSDFETVSFREAIPRADVTIFLKFLPELELLRHVAAQTRIIFCPVDVYGSAAEIDADAERLFHCDRVVVHCERLAKYLRGYAHVVALEHHLKYVAEVPETRPSDGPLLWVGERSNLPPFVEWVNQHGLQHPLLVLTNVEPGQQADASRALSFRADCAVQVERWSAKGHLAWLPKCRAAIDIKASDFRARHKPAAKACDFLASGVPLAISADSSSAEFLHRRGFAVATPDSSRWLSQEYLAETVRFGGWLRDSLSLTSITPRWVNLLNEVLSEPIRRTHRVQTRIPSMGEASKPGPSRVAIVSLLFNWPSTGGGTVHTAETARFLTRAGYEVRHFSVRYDPWGLGQVHEPTDWPLRELAFSQSDWSRSKIERRVREAVDEFRPDAVIITDSWSMKPRLAAALSGYRVYLRVAAQECLCPLNNVRLLALRPRPESCPLHQLATPQICRECVATRGQFSGSLHQLERQLADFTAADYSDALRRAFADAAGVLVVNPQIAEMVKPFARGVHVIPSGFDPSRFPWDQYHDEPVESERPVSLLFAGLIEEPMKGFEVLRSACRILRSQNKKFRLVVTSDRTTCEEDSFEYIGWQSQANLPQRMRQADVVVCPSIAEEALGRTAVEAMGAWRPVVASRLGGFPYTVLEEATGLLSEPGDPVDLARQLARLIDDPALRERLGTQGRQRFEAHYAWNVILDRHYLPLLGRPIPLADAPARGDNSS